MKSLMKLMILTMMIFLIGLTACTCVPDPVESLPLPADPHIEQVEFHPLYIVSDQQGNIRYVKMKDSILENESVVGKIYALSREGLEAYIRNNERLWASIDKLKKRIDPDYEPALE